MTTTQTLEIGQRVSVQDGRWTGTITEVGNDWASVDLDYLKTFKTVYGPVAFGFKDLTTI